MRRGQILLVEDSKDLADIMKDLLSGAGFEVITAKNGKEAVEQPNLPTVDLIIMDIEMPVMNGIDATIHLRQQGCKVPIIAYSGAVDIDQSREFLSARFSAYVKKPVDFQIILAVIDNLFNKGLDSAFGARDAFL